MNTGAEFAGHRPNGDDARPDADARPNPCPPCHRGKQVENWKGCLRDWPDPDMGMWQTGQAPSWKSVNYKRCARTTCALCHNACEASVCVFEPLDRWPLHRLPKYDRTGIEVSL